MLGKFSIVGTIFVIMCSLLIAGPGGSARAAAVDFMKKPDGQCVNGKTGLPVAASNCKRAAPKQKPKSN
jgi:hypothetical protein